MSGGTYWDIRGTPPGKIDPRTVPARTNSNGEWSRRVQHPE